MVWNTGTWSSEVSGMDEALKKGRRCSAEGVFKRCCERGPARFSAERIEHQSLADG
jgi:hypothetical protein